MKKLFVTLIAEGALFSFCTPWARLEDTAPFCVAPIRRPSKESLSNVVMCCGMAAALDGRACISIHDSVETTTTDSARFFLGHSLYLCGLSELTRFQYEGELALSNRC